VSSTAGVAGIGFLAMFLPSLVASVMPSIMEFSPTNVHTWAFALATHGTVVWTLPLATVLAIGLLGFGAKVVFDRQEL